MSIPTSAPINPDPFPPTGPDGLPDRGGVDVIVVVVRYQVPSPLGSTAPAEGGFTLTVPSKATPAEVFELARQAITQIPGGVITRIFRRGTGDETITIWSAEEPR